MRSTIFAVLREVLSERVRQDNKWGEQNHPDHDPVLYHTVRDHQRMADEYEIPGEARAKFLCQQAFAINEGCWFKVLVEEIAEACAAPTPGLLRQELIQVAVAWIECIDRRNRK